MNSPIAPTLRQPYVRLKLIEAKDVYNAGELSNLYIQISYDTQTIDKTQAIEMSACPFWDKKIEFDYDIETYEGINAITLSVYDSDPLGMDELIANQVIPLHYFKERREFGKPLDLWLKLLYLDAYSIKKHILVETSTSLFQELEYPYFREQIAVQDDIENKEIPKIHVALEIYDEVAIIKLNMKIKAIEEREGSCGKVFVYVINIRRNDGLEWTIRKRYSEILQFRDRMLHHDEEVKNFEFPPKDFTKFLSRILPGCIGYYKKVTEERKEILEKWLNDVASINYLYNTDEFVEFFTSEAKTEADVDVEKNVVKDRDSTVNQGALGRQIV